MCRFEGGGGGGIKRKGEPPSQSSHTHSPCLSLEGKQSLHSQGWAVKCLSFLSIQHLLPVALPPSPLHLERKTLARNKSGEYLKRIKCGLFFFFFCFNFFYSRRSGLDERNTSRFGVIHSAVSLSQSLRATREGSGKGAAAAAVQPRAPTPGSYHPEAARHGSVYTLFRVLAAPRQTGMTHPEMQVFRSAG